MEVLGDKIYLPSMRASKFELLALLELEEDRKRKISPILSARGNKKQISAFAEKWGDNSPFWLDASRFAQDTSDELTGWLNNPENNFENKLRYFLEVSELNQLCMPVIGFRAGDSARAVTQLSLKTLDNFPAAAIRIDGEGKALERKISTARAILNAVSDSDFSRILLIVDLTSKTEMPSLEDESPVQKILSLVDEYPLNNVLTLSTSWPDERPERGSSCYVPCLDPVWQAQVHHQLHAKGIKCYYGDYASTNPVKDIVDDYDPSAMAAPIPFAGYFLPFGWYQERKGKSGENERFRDIAGSIRALPGYHGDMFCWGTKEIASIANSQREKAGNVSYWNKIRINQHICAMLQELEANALERIVNAKRPGDEDDDLELA